MVAELERRALRAGLAEEIERQEREDNALGPEPEGLIRRVRVSAARAVDRLVSGIGAAA